MKSRSSIFHVLAIILSAITLSSCTPKNIGYMQDVDTSTIDIAYKAKEIKIEPHDKLSIVINTTDPALSDLFNLPVMASRIGVSNTGSGALLPASHVSQSDGILSYTVTPDGNIDFPVLGKLHVVGMSRSELAGFIKGELMGRNLVKDPVVTVEFVNTGISVLGEVKKPGRYDINKDNLNLLEGLALAGDLDIQGRRDNVLVMREINGKMQTYRIDLSKGKEMMESPGFYLKQNDVIYVEPNNMKKRSAASVNGNTVLQASFWVSIASALASISVLIFK